MELLQVYMSEDISNPLGTVSNKDLPVISAEFMDVHLLLAYLEETEETKIEENSAACHSTDIRLRTL
jgi:hypothetical protein